MKLHVFLATLFATLMLAACAESAALDDGVASLSGDSAESTTTITVDQEAAMLAFSECMREQGIDLPDPTVDSDGNAQILREGDGPPPIAEREAMEAAFETCDEHLEGMTSGFDTNDQTELQDRLLEFAQCMRDNGVEMDDPDLTAFRPADESDEGTPPRGGFLGQGFDPSDPAVQEALETCQDLAGGGPGSGGGGVFVRPGVEP